MKKALFVLALLMIPDNARAQFGAGQLILLGKIAAQDVLIYGSTSATAAKAATIAETAIHQMELAKQMAQPIETFKYRGFGGLVQGIPSLLNLDRYGLATPWVRAIGGMEDSTSAYLTATVPVPFGESTAYYVKASPEQQHRIGVEYAELLYTDAANAAAIKVIGDINAATPLETTAVNNLVEDTFASGFMGDPQLSLVALNQKQAIANGMHVQLGQQNKQLLTVIAQQLVLINTRARNEKAAKLNSDAIIHQQQAEAQQGVQGLSSALTSFRY